MPDLRWVRALAHPARVEILDVLDSRPTASPKELSSLLSRPLEDVSYHCKTLWEADCIEEVKKVARRGVYEHYYRAKPNSTFSHQRWRSVPRSLRGTVTAKALEGFMRRAVAALRAGTIDDRDDTVLSCMPVAVDERGFTQITKALGAVQAEVEKISGDSRRRLRRDPDKAIQLVVGFAAFEAAAIGGHSDQ